MEESSALATPAPPPYAQSWPTSWPLPAPLCHLGCPPSISALPLVPVSCGATSRLVPWKWLPVLLRLWVLESVFRTLRGLCF